MRAASPRESAHLGRVATTSARSAIGHLVHRVVTGRIGTSFVSTRSRERAVRAGATRGELERALKDNVLAVPSRRDIREVSEEGSDKRSEAARLPRARSGSTKSTSRSTRSARRARAGRRRRTMQDRPAYPGGTVGRKVSPTAANRPFRLSRRGLSQLRPSPVDRPQRLLPVSPQPVIKRAAHPPRRFSFPADASTVRVRGVSVR